jgi:hypothetical protein
MERDIDRIPEPQEILVGRKDRVPSIRRRSADQEIGVRALNPSAPTNVEIFCRSLVIRRSENFVWKRLKLISKKLKLFFRPHARKYLLANTSEH